MCVGEKPLMDIPPSTHIICPVMYDDAGKQRKVTREDTSAGSPRRLRGVREYTSSR